MAKGTRIGEYRRGYGMSVVELAEALGIDEAVMVQWEVDAAKPDVSVARDAALLFECSVEDLEGRNPMGAENLFSTANRAFGLTGDGDFDGYWGSFGVRCGEIVRWYPISRGAMEAFVGKAEGRSGKAPYWAAAMTLDNILLLVNLERVSATFLVPWTETDVGLDRALPEGGCEPVPLEIFRGLSLLADDMEGMGNEWISGTSKGYRETVEVFCRDSGLGDAEGIRSYLRNVTVVDGTGRTSSVGCTDAELLTAFMESEEASMETCATFTKDGVRASFRKGDVVMMELPLLRTIDAINAMEEID